jgi:hypothetical protein
VAVEHGVGQVTRAPAGGAEHRIGVWPHRGEVLPTNARFDGSDSERIIAAGASGHALGVASLKLAERFNATRRVDQS